MIWYDIITRTQINDKMNNEYFDDKILQFRDRILSNQVIIFDVYESVHRDTTMENNQQDALYRLIYYSKSAPHVSDDVFVHRQGHLTVFTVSGSVHPSCCRLVSHSGQYLVVFTQVVAGWCPIRNTSRQQLG